MCCTYMSWVLFVAALIYQKKSYTVVLLFFSNLQTPVEEDTLSPMEMEAAYAAPPAYHHDDMEEEEEEEEEEYSNHMEHLSSPEIEEEFLGKHIPRAFTDDSGISLGGYTCSLYMRTINTGIMF